MQIRDFIQNIIFSSLIFILPLSIFPQGAAGTDAENEMRYLVDMPTGGILKEKKMAIDFEILPLGTVISKLEFSPLKNFSLGLSYGAYNLIGSGKIDFYINPGFHARIRLFTETRNTPSLIIGFNSQGKGLYSDSLKRYNTKSPGIFLSTTKNYKFLGYLTIHGSMNYSLEYSDGDDNINFGLGFEKTFGPFLSLIFEYDFALNDNSNESFGKGKGYLNLGLRISPSTGLTIGFDIKDILNNSNYYSDAQPIRSLYIEYIFTLF